MHQKTKSKLIKQKNSLINFFPLDYQKVRKRIAKSIWENSINIFSWQRNIKEKIKISKLLEDETFVDFAGLDQGIAYLFTTSLNGKRHIGSMSKILNRCSENIVLVSTIGSGFNSPLLVVNTSNQRAFICSSVSKQAKTKEWLKENHSKRIKCKYSIGWMKLTLRKFSKKFTQYLNSYLGSDFKISTHATTL